MIALALIKGACGNFWIKGIERRVLEQQVTALWMSNLFEAVEKRELSQCEHCVFGQFPFL